MPLPFFALVLSGLTLAVASPDTVKPDEAEESAMIERVEWVGPVSPARRDSQAVPARLRRAPPKFSLTLSPLHLLALFPEITGEYRPHPFWSVAATGGAMWYTDGSSIREIGGQLRVYPGGVGSGAHLGVEGFLARLHTGTVSDGDDDWLAGIFDDVTFYPYGGGPFVGLKHVGREGFTFDFQVGAQIIRIVGERELGVFPILNLNFGKSF